MFLATVYDDGHKAEGIKQFGDVNELTVVRKAMAKVRYLRAHGNPPVGRYTFHLEVVKDKV